MFVQCNRYLGDQVLLRMLLAWSNTPWSNVALPMIRTAASLILGSLRGCGENHRREKWVELLPSCKPMVPRTSQLVFPELRVTACGNTQEPEEPNSALGQSSQSYQSDADM